MDGKNDNLKEVYFDQYCKTCENRKKKEYESPCDSCLEEPSNQESHKPVYYESDK